MKIQLGGGRAVTVMLSASDKMNVNGIAYPDQCSLCFHEGRGGDAVEVFASRDQLKAFAESILESILNCES